MKFFEKKADLALVVMGLLVTLLSLGALAYKFSEPLIEGSKAKEKSQAAALRLSQQQTIPITPAPAQPIVVAMVQPEVAVAPEFVTITIRRGDTLTRISRKETCDTIGDIVKRNTIKNPDLIFVGQQVKVKAECSPEAGKLKASPEKFAQGVPPDGASQEKLLTPESPTAKVAPAPATKESGKQIVSAPAPTATTLAHYDGPALALPRKEPVKKTFDPAPAETEAPMVPRRKAKESVALPVAQARSVNCASEGARIKDHAQKTLAIASCVKREYGALITDAVRTVDPRVDPLLVLAVMLVESRGNPRAVSKPRHPHEPCYGLMQLQPPTARQYGVRTLFDPKENIEGGVRVLSSYIFTYQGGNVARGLVSYNAGPHSTLWKKRGFDPERFGYTQKVMQNHRVLMEHGFTL